MRTNCQATFNLRAGLRAAALLCAALAAGQAQAYAEYGYYSGAYATPGESGCWGAVGQGVNPSGGCTPGDYPLAYSTAFVYGIRGPNNHASLTADIASATLYGSSIFPGGASNSPGGAANLLDTLTITGSLPQPVNIVVTLTIDSTISGPPDTQAEPVQAWLLNGGGLQAAYVRDLTSCYWPEYGGAQCDTGYGRTLRTISHTETVSDAQRTFQVAAALYLGGSYLLVDASATISVALPAGLGYTSASGVFPAALVPEAGTWSMMLCGIAVLGLAARQRRFNAEAASPTSAGPR